MAKITTALFGELALLPYQAQAPATESLEFLTDIMESHNGSEQRVQLRSMPRQVIQYNIPVKLWNIAAAFNSAYGAIRKRWALPLWTEVQYVGNISGGTKAISCDTQYRDIREYSLVMIYNLAGDWQVLETSTKTNTVVNLGSPANAINSSYLVPVRLAWTNSNIDKVTNGFEDVYSIEFETEDNLPLSPSTPSQYLSNDIYYDETLVSGSSTSKSLQKQLDRIDYMLGNVDRRSPWNNARYSSTKRSVLEGAQQVKAYKEFLYRRAGKFRPFWFPLFEQNLRITDADIITNSITIDADCFTDYTMRPHIAIESSSGVWYPRSVSNPTPVIGNRIQLTLDNAINLPPSELRRVSFLGLHRLNTDKIELRWLGNGVAESEYNVLEISP